MLMTTGRFPANFAGGLYRKPEIDRPSKVFQRASSGSAKADVFSPPVSLSVQRSTLPVSTSSAYTSLGERAETSTKPRSLLLWCHLTSRTEPAGNGDGNGFS